MHNIKDDNLKKICSSLITNWYRNIRTKQVLRRFKNYNYDNSIDLLDYYDGYWDYMGLESDMNIVDNDKNYFNNYDNIYDFDISEDDFDISEDDFSKDININGYLQEKKNKTLFEYILSFFF